MMGIGRRKEYTYTGSDFGADFGPEDYALLYRSSTRSALLLSAGVQYVLNRRERFQTIAGMNLITPLYERSEEKITLAGGTPYEEHFVRRITTQDRYFLAYLLPIPQFTLQYPVSQHLLLTAGLGSLSGVGATYGW